MPGARRAGGIAHGQGRKTHVRRRDPPGGAGLGADPYAIALESGVSQPVLSRFLRGERGINLDTAEKLCRALGLKLRPKE